MINQNSSVKKSQKSPNEKLLKSFYSKQKSKSQHSPNAHRSISKEQIKNQIKKVVYRVSHGQQQRQVASRHQSEYREMSLGPKQQSNRSNIHISLTPKNYDYSKKEVREVRTSKGSQSKGKEMFASSRYDLKKLFDRKKEQISREKPSSMQKRNLNSQSKYQEEETLKINQKNREEPNCNVKSYLTAEEFSKFGDRFPDHFRRVGLLGRGGFSLVWLGVHKSSKRKVAIKQILTKNPHQTHLKQIWFGSYFFEKGGQPREQFEHHIGINNICKLYSHEITTIDSWLYYELCDESLGSCLFQLKGEVVNGERFYRIQYKELIRRIRADQNELKVLLIEVSKALFLMNSHNIVHSDLKTQNILLRTKRSDDDRDVSFIRAVKLIDFGSSFLFTNLKQFSMATPEYMPPEILNYILFQNKMEYDSQMLKKMQKYKNPWVIDVWSLGCIILQIVSGIPLWMSIDTKIQQKQHRATGLFSAKNRVFSKIIQKQIQVVNNIDYHLDNQNYSGIIISQDVRKILKRMLELDPMKRISPYQILKSFGIGCEPIRIPSY